jgi:hypothetical protein
LKYLYTNQFQSNGFLKDELFEFDVFFKKMTECIEGIPIFHLMHGKYLAIFFFNLNEIFISNSQACILCRDQGVFFSNSSTQFISEDLQH